MYVPKRFDNKDLEKSLALMRRYPFATVISAAAEGPFLSHLPLMIETVADGVILHGHLARANPHWKLLADRPVLAVFHGPNSYITPRWYTDNDVPTWNYAVVHVKGPAVLVEDRAGIAASLQRLTRHVEGEGPESWKFWIPPDLEGEGVLEKAIVAFTIKAETVQAKFKLNQNRSRADREGVVKGLEGRPDDMSRDIRALMQQTLAEDGQL